MFGDMLGDVALMVIGVIGVGGAILTAVGAGLLAVGIIQGRNVENFDEIAPKIMKVCGVLLLIVGLMVLCGDGVGGFAYVTENYGYAMPVTQPTAPVVTKNPYAPLQNEWDSTTDADEAAEMAVERLLDSAYHSIETPSDQYLFEEMFAEVVRTDPVFATEVTSFLNQIPEGIDYTQLVSETPAMGQGSNDSGLKMRTGHKTWRYETDEEIWFISVKYCYDSNVKENKGVTEFIIEDLASRADNKDLVDYPEYITVYKGTPSDGEHAALIWGEAFILKDHDNPATAEELKKYVDEGATTLTKLKEKMGEPDCVENRSDKNSIDYYYELAPENGEALYAWIEVIDGEDDLWSVDLLTATELLADRNIYQRNPDTQN